jgi:hypothetical protein
MATGQQRHADEALVDFIKEFFKNLYFRLRDDWDIAKTRAFLGLIIFCVGVVFPFFFDSRVPLLILIILTLICWWNFILRTSFIAGTIGVLEGILPIFQTDKEMEGPVTNDGRIAAGHTYNFLADVAAILLAIMFVPLIFPVPIRTIPYWYSVMMLMFFLAGVFTIEIPTKRIETVGGKKQDDKPKDKEKK